jgi:hypothetical protein
MFDLLNDAHSKYYAPSEHLAVDKIAVFFQGEGNF